MNNKWFAILGLAALVGLLVSGCFGEMGREGPAGPGSAPSERTLALGELTGTGGPEISGPLKKTLAEQPGIKISPGAPEVLSGSVRLTINDDSGEDLVMVEEETGQKREVTSQDPFVDREFTRTEPEVLVKSRSVPFVQRRAEAVMDYRLPSGNDQGTVTAVFTQKYGGVNEYSPQGPKLKDLPDRSDTVARLAGQLAWALADRLSPAEARLQLMAEGPVGMVEDSDINQGVTLAREGLWDEAAAVWRSVLAKDPEHPVANYNLGISLERKGGRENLEQARDLYSKAIRVGNHPLYREAITRVTVRLRELENE